MNGIPIRQRLGLAAAVAVLLLAVLASRALGGAGSNRGDYATHFSPAVLTGQVTRGGAAVNGAAVTTVAGHRAVTDASGSYTLHLDLPGIYAVTARSGADTVGGTVEVALGATGTLNLVLPQAASATAWLAGAMSRTRRDDAPGAATSLQLRAARNEWEPFQVSVRAEGSPATVTGVTVGDFTGAAGTLPASNVTLSRAQPIQVTTPSPNAASGPSLGAGWYPDILVPFKHPDSGADLTGATYDAVPFTVAAGQNATFWADLFIPAGTAPGDYQATVTVSFQSLVPQQLTLNLTVWGFTLPQTTSVRSHFFIPHGELDSYYGLAGDAAAINLMQRRYADALLAHRLMPGFLQELTPPVDVATGNADFTAAVPGVGGTVAGAYAHYLDTRRASIVQLPFITSYPWTNPRDVGATSAVNSYLQQLYDFMNGRGWANRAYVYTMDEPDSAEDFAYIKDIGARAIARGHKSLVTTDPTDDNGNLVGAVNLWVPHAGSIPAKLTALQGRQAAGDEVWSYTTLADVQINGGAYPVWLIDYPPLHHRVNTWLNHRHGFKGMLYWTTAYWHKPILKSPPSDPWLDPDTYDAAGYEGLTFNGEGVLFYPGTVSKAGFDGPVASMRLKWLRESLEDGEYLRILKDLGGEAAAQTAISSWITGWGQFSVNPADLDNARAQVATQILALMPVKLAVTAPTPESPNPAPATFSVTVQAKDAGGTLRPVLEPTGVSLSVKTGGGSLGGITAGTIPAGQSAVTLSGVNYSQAENNVALTATRTGGDPLAPGDSQPFNVVTAAPSTVLAFTQQPVKGAHTFALGRPPIVVVQQGTAAEVTLRIKAGTGTPGAVLSCSGGLTKPVVDGVASFLDCTIDLKGTGYVLEATATGAAPVATQPFDVVWAGDLNGDCLVDILDFSVLVGSFGRQLGNAGFDARADSNGDHKVDLLDFSLLATLFGTRCPVLGLTPASGAVGAEVTVTVTAFVANREVNLTINGQAIVTTPPVVTTGGDGGFTARFSIPSQASGTYAVKAGQAGGRVLAAASLTVNP